MQMLLSHKMISNAPLVPNPFLIRAILKDTRRSHVPRMINLRGSKNPQRSTSSAGFAISLSHLRRSSFIIRSMVTLGMKLCHLMLILLLCYPKDQRRVSQILPRQLSSKKRSSKSLIKFSKTQSIPKAKIIYHLKRETFSISCLIIQRLGSVQSRVLVIMILGFPSRIKEFTNFMVLTR